MGGGIDWTVHCPDIRFVWNAETLDVSQAWQRGVCVPPSHLAEWISMHTEHIHRAQQMHAEGRLTYPCPCGGKRDV